MLNPKIVRKCTFAGREAGTFANSVMLFCIVISGFGCTSLSIRAPVPQTFLSEVQGNEEGHKFRAEGGLYGVRTDELTSSVSSRPVNLNPKNNIDQDIYLHGAYGFFERFEAIAQLSAATIFSLAGQYQILGETRGQKPKSGFSWTVGAQVHYWSTTRSGDQNGAFGPGGYDWKARARLSGYGPQTAIGYRFSEDWLTTIGFAYLKYELNGSIFHDRSRDGTSPEQTYNFGGDGEGKTLSLAFVYGRRVYLTFGVQASDVSLPVTGQRRDVLGFLRLGGGPVPE